MLTNNILWIIMRGIVETFFTRKKNEVGGGIHPPAPSRVKSNKSPFYNFFSVKSGFYMWKSVWVQGKNNEATH